MDQIILSSLLNNIFETISTSNLDQDYLIDYCHFLGIQKPEVDRTILLKLESFYISYGYLPENIDTFSHFILSNCFCGAIPLEDINEASKVLSHILAKACTVAPCHVVAIFLEFYKQEKRMANEDEIFEYINNLRRINEDPERYYQDTKMHLPTQNLSLLTPQKSCKDDNCGLCLEEIKEGEECFILPCNHIFHSDEEKCLNTTVKKWLSENKSCPMCKQEVIIPTKEDI